MYTGHKRGSTALMTSSAARLSAPAPSSEARNPKHHLLIAGAGRTGTSFLVRYFTELGLETHLARHGPQAWIDEAANAGLEDIPLSSLSDDFPYVVKTPWAFEFIDEMLADPSIHIDGVVIPVRDLQEAASSRIILEQRAAVEHSPWRLKLKDAWRHFGFTPGGILASLEPLDQERILATGFHHLVQRLIAADVPIHFLAFPRLATDGGYLFDRLQGLLPCELTREAAVAVHNRIADPSKIRVGSELGSISRGTSRPSLAELERVALARECERLKGAASDADVERQRKQDEVARLATCLAEKEAEGQARHGEDSAALARAGNEIDRLNAEAQEFRDHIHKLTADYAAQKALVDRLELLSHEQQVELGSLRDQVSATTSKLNLMSVSLSWRLTAPVRWFSAFL